MSRLLSILGVICTLAYMAALWWFFDGRLSEIRSMPPNNIGDFLAGVFGPLAILWLILGFFQQGVELRQNTRALDLQAEELHNSVEQQRSLVEVSRKQMETELEAIRFERDRQAAAALPRFVFHGVGGMHSVSSTYQSIAKNLGNTVTDVVFSYEPAIEVSSITKVFSWTHGEEKKLEWRYKTPHAEYPVKLSITFIDAVGTPGVQTFEFSPVKGDGYPMVEIAPCLI